MFLLRNVGWGWSQRGQERSPQNCQARGRRSSLLQHLLVGVVMNTQPLQEYISRLSGRPVGFDEVISLSSAQQAAVRLMRRNNGRDGIPAALTSRVSATE